MLHSTHLESCAIREAYGRMPSAFRDTPQSIHGRLGPRPRVTVSVKVETLTATVTDRHV